VETNGAAVVLLVHAERCYEVVRKDGDMLVLNAWNRFFEESLAKLEADGFKAARGLKIVKANGTLMYAVPQTEGTDWYISGKKYPGARKKSK
jgi:hypothetical protein